jgi:hypothetical protein
MLDTVKVEDWVALNVRGLYKLERVTRVSDVLVVTERYNSLRAAYCGRRRCRASRHALLYSIRLRSGEEEVGCSTLSRC